MDKTTVFWPEKCRKSGLVYGWTRPTVCVIGVLDASCSDDVIRSRLAESPLWKAMKDICAEKPRIIGRCQFDKGSQSPIPTLLALDHTGTYSFVLYSQHSPQFLRHYVLKWSAPALSSDPYHALASHDFTLPKPRQIDEALNEVAVEQMNAASVVHSVVQNPDKPPKLLPTTATLLLTIAAHSTFFSPLLLGICSLISVFTNLSLPFPPSLKRGTLKEVFAVVQQIDVRVDQTTFFINQVSTLQRKNTRDTRSYSMHYTEFFNTVWLIMNDLSLGVAFGSFLLENSEALARMANFSIQRYLFDTPRAVLFWLDAWPAGLKLNTQLSRFYATTLIGIIDTWREILPSVHPRLISCLGLLSSIGGLTLLLSLVSDILCFFVTAHLRLGYELTRVVYWAAGVKLGSGLLWGVFRGKRWNVLRNRTDTWSYDMDQLLFGTILFTLIVFLFPTAFVYYSLFAGLRLATLLCQACIETQLAFMHHFPLFALMLRVKDPSRLPGNICFELKQTSGTLSGAASSYLVLKNQPISFSKIFFQYIELWKRLARHYNPLRLLYLVLTGRHIASIPRYSIRYTHSLGSLDVNGTSKEKTE